MKGAWTGDLQQALSVTHLNTMTVKSKAKTVNAKKTTEEPMSLMTPREVATYLNCSLSWVYRNLGRIGGFRIGKLCRIEKQVFFEYLRLCQEKEKEKVSLKRKEAQREVDTVRDRRTHSSSHKKAEDDPYGLYAALRGEKKR